MLGQELRAQINRDSGKQLEVLLGSWDVSCAFTP